VIFRSVLFQKTGYLTGFEPHLAGFRCKPVFRESSLCLAALSRANSKLLRLVFACIEVLGFIFNCVVLVILNVMPRERQFERRRI